MQNGVQISEAQYRKLQREIIASEQSMGELEKSSKKASKQVKDVGDNSKNASVKLETLKGATSGVAKGMATIATTGAGALTAIGAMAMKAGASADDINTIAAQTGLATEQIQMFQYATDTIDVSLDTLTGSMSKLTKNMATASKGTGDAYNAFKELGVSITNTDGTLRNNQDVFNETIEKLGQMENETQRDALAMQIFGKSAQELNPLIKGGAETLAQMGQQAKKLGIILDQDTLDKANDFNDQIDLLKANASGAFSALGSEIAGELVPYMEELNTVTMDAIGNLIQAFREDGLEGLVNEFTNILVEIVNKIISYLPKMAEMGIQIIQTLLNGINSNISSITNAVVQVVSTLLKSFLNMLPQILEMGITIIVELVNGIAQQMPELIPAIVECVILIVETLIDNLDMLIEAAIQIILALTQGLIDALPRLIDKLPEIILKIVNAIIENAPMLLEAALQLIIMLGQGLIDALSSLDNAINTVVSWIIDGLSIMIDKIKNVGKNIIEGLWNGMKSAKDWLIGKIKELCTNALDAIKNFFGIASPSKVMRDEVGKYMAEGIGVGFNKKMPSVIEAMKDKLSTVTSALNTELNFGDIPEVQGNKIISENSYITKNYTNTIETIRQPSNIELSLNGMKFARAIIPSLNEEYVRMGVKA